MFVDSKLEFSPMVVNWVEDTGCRECCSYGNVSGFEKYEEAGNIRTGFG